MLTADVVAHFGTKTNVARALDVHKQAISKWGPLVPESAAYKLESITRGKLRVDPAVYRNMTARQAKLAAAAGLR